jgi:hypothetical protein
MTQDNGLEYTPMDVGRKEAKALSSVFNRITAEIKTCDVESLKLAYLVAASCRDDFERLVNHHTVEDEAAKAQQRWEEQERQKRGFRLLTEEEIQKRWFARHGHSIAEGR